MDDVRVPPQALDMERAVLGSMMLERAVISDAVEMLKAEDFYRTAHQIVLRTILSLYEREEAVDALTVVAELQRAGTLDEVGGPMYVAGMTLDVAVPSNIRTYARVVREKAKLRILLWLASKIQENAYEEKDADRIAEATMLKLFDLRLGTNGYVPLSEAVLSVDWEAGEGILSGFSDLDRLIRLRAGEMVTLAGATSMGKSAFAQALAVNVARKSIPVGIFSLEMPREHWVKRMVSAEGEVSTEKMLQRNLSEEEWHRIDYATSKMVDWPVFLDDTMGITPLELRAKVSKMVLQEGVKMVFVDYMQLMDPGVSTGSREQDVAHISGSLKGIARDYRIPVVVLSQLSREVDRRLSKGSRPQLSDLRESGRIEQDSDIVMFVYRPEQYGIDQLDGRSVKGKAEIIVAKHRNGPTGSVWLQWTGEFVRFRNLETRRTA